MAKEKPVSKSPVPLAAPSVPMTWAEAQASLLEGRKITRLAWASDEQVFVHADVLHLRKADGTLHTLIVSVGDMSACDWIVVREI